MPGKSRGARLAKEDLGHVADVGYAVLGFWVDVVDLVDVDCCVRCCC